METIIGLLVVLLPVIFKLIEKRLEKASEATQPVEDWEQEIQRYLQQQQNGPENLQTEKAVEKAPVEKIPVVNTMAEGIHAVKPKNIKPVLAEEEKKKEKIDVKKMIVYSEIMKPKYNE